MLPSNLALLTFQRKAACFLSYSIYPAGSSPVLNAPSFIYCTATIYKRTINAKRYFQSKTVRLLRGELQHLPLVQALIQSRPFAVKDEIFSRCQKIFTKNFLVICGQAKNNLLFFTLKHYNSFFKSRKK